jgi:hypothetical protein
MMTQRFADLKKVPDQPAVRLLALANARLQTKLSTPANASVQAVLEELERAGAFVDMLRLMSVALPPRERVWWACLAARDILGSQPDAVPPPLLAAENWVRKPSDEARDAARAAIDLADMEDDTVFCANAVVFCDDTLGPGDLAKHPAPPGAAQTSAFGMNICALGTGTDPLKTADYLLDRGVDIARGGNGKIARLETEEETAP